MTKPKSEPLWYAIYTKPQCEALANRNLKARGYTTFAPVRRIRRRRRLPNGHHHVDWIEVPHFTRYIFVALFGRGHESAGEINDTIGVSSIVGNADGPLNIPHEVMDEIMAKCDDEGKIRHVDKRERALYPPGTRVRFKDNNPLQGLFAQISVDCGDSVRVEVESLGAIREVRVSPEQIGTVAE